MRNSKVKMKDEYKKRDMKELKNTKQAPQYFFKIYTNIQKKKNKKEQMRMRRKKYTLIAEFIWITQRQNGHNVVFECENVVKFDFNKIEYIKRKQEKKTK